MTLCMIVSAYCGSHASLTNVSQIFKYTNLLLKRCSKIGCGDVLLLFQDIYGKWTKYKWSNWMHANGRKIILNFVNKQQNICLQQLQQQTTTTSPPSPSLITITMLEELKNCIIDCKNHSLSSLSSSSSSFIYHIIIIGNENCLSLNDDIYLNANKSNIKLQEILSLSRIIPININMLCLCSPLKNKKYIEFNLINNCCSICNQQFFRTKPNKKQHFPKSCHQIALKQIKIQKCYKKCKLLLINDNNDNDNDNEPPLKKRKLNNDESGDNEYDLKQMVISCSVLFWQKLIDNTSGIFRWIFTDFNQSNIDLIFQSLSNKIASHTKLRYIAIGSLMGQCQIYPGPNNNYFVSPNNLNNKIIKFASLNEKQLKFELNQQIKQIPMKYNNSFIKAIYKNMNDTEWINICPLNILQENTLNISIGGDILSILGFLDRDNEWLSIPILSRHFIIPFVNTANEKNDGGDICIFIKELLFKHNKIGLVNLNPPNKPSWYGLIHCDKQQSKGQYLLFDILSPYINTEQLLEIENKQKATPQYTLPNNIESESTQQSMLTIYDNVSSYFHSETNVIKEFDKFIRLFKQKKILECFEIAEIIRKRALMFHIPHLIKHLLTIINKEINNISFDNDKLLKHQCDILIKLINQSQNDKRIKIIWNPPSSNHNNQQNKKQQRHHNKNKNKHKNKNVIDPRRPSQFK